MREEKKMSSFTTIACASASSQGYAVPVCKENVGNGLVLVRELAGISDAGALTDAASIDVVNNATQQLTSAQTTLNLNVNCAEGEVPNFAVEISAGAAITLTLTKTVGNTVTTLWPSEAGGTALESGKYYQVTCVGKCWTLAEFVDPNAQRNVVQDDDSGNLTLPETRALPEELGDIAPVEEPVGGDER